MIDRYMELSLSVFGKVHVVKLGEDAAGVSLRMEGDWVPHWGSSERESLWAFLQDSEADIGADVANSHIVRIAVVS